MKKFLNSLFSTRASGMYILLFAISIGVATFIENDYGTSSAQSVIYRSKWFELLLILFGTSILVNIFRYRMIQQKKWSLLIFHLAMLVILAGAAITRYAGSEGRMHIREGDVSNEIISAESYLQFEATRNGKTYHISEPVYFSSLGKNKFDESYQFGDDVYRFRMTGFIPNPTQEMIPDANEPAVLKVVIAGGAGREEYYLRQGEKQNLHGTWFNFTNVPVSGAINITYTNNALLVNPPFTMTQLVMATQTRDTIQAGEAKPLQVRALYSNGDLSFVIGDFSPGARLAMKSSSPKLKNESVAAVQLEASDGKENKTVYVYGNYGMVGSPQDFQLGNTRFRVSYGSIIKSLPFGIRLHDFIMERYPGTNSASSYASEVTLIDPRTNLNQDYRIFMNHILTYEGYRFFQSSFDQDELGTILSVNHDFWGTWMSYLGYFLLTLGLIMTFFSKKSRFYQLSQRLEQMRTQSQRVATLLIPALMLVGSHQVRANSPNVKGKHIIPVEQAKAFGSLVVQDQKGRFKPVNTMTDEVLRKISRKETWNGQNSDQVYLGMQTFPEEWMDIPFIKIGSNSELHDLLHVDGKYASYNDFFNPEYVLRDLVRRAYNMEPRDRGTLEKEAMKLDEKVNICNLVFSGRLAKLFPVVNDQSNRWVTSYDASQIQSRNELEMFVAQYHPSYVAALKEGLNSGDWSGADRLVNTLDAFQQKFGGEVIPSHRKVNLEIALNKANVFGRLGSIYALVGLLLLVAFFTTVFTDKMHLQWPVTAGFGVLAFFFLLHTLGLAIRWYVSGHAPWSNGYESMIYIAWTTVMAGLIFARKSLGGMASTAILASVILMVAHLSWLDPEITPLVPVLKSYWLTIHVSMEAGSYGFLTLGAIIGALNLLLMIFANANNKTGLFRRVKEMTYISEMTLIGGLVMISIGTYLGGVWANESWGRYWGWDAKETWALVTILVYAFILHMRLIPGMRGMYAFNVASLFGFATVMMTYFGVNYYLSGLHSYAAGDPVPIPTFVYYTVGSLTLISLLAFWKYRKFGPTN
ncbi:MAG: cytochrome c biogenesis protein CcsA [Saprospiraceae bacterium]|nr:cytochrome c biogenesis protein CcsA [Saprospiraceae bacterium]